MIDSSVMQLWKKIAVGILIACVGLLAFAIASAKLGSRRLASAPGAWNSQAIEGTPAGIRVQEIDPTHAAVIFLYDLDNKTDTDYRLDKGPDVVVMTRLKSGGTLSGDEPVSLDSGAFVPARNRTRIALEVNHVFHWPGQRGAYAERAFDQLVAGDVSGIAGFVLFDQTNRYEIDFPGAWPQAEADSATH
ncbi:MAG TPA: hypothetical protein VMB02_05365 [Candidatus Aquilonibacter sp.]|nr:hypothetical protein [Candidatus Aquilonibacter sp.]